MKITLKDNLIYIFINKKLINESLEKEEEIYGFIKDIVLKLKKKRIQDISGLYNVYVYQNSKYGLILELTKEDEIEFFQDIIDLKVNFIKNSPIYLELEDIFLIKNINKKIINKKYYVNINDLDEKQFLKLTEFSKIIFGKTATKIDNKNI